MVRTIPGSPSRWEAGPLFGASAHHLVYLKPLYFQFDLARLTDCTEWPFACSPADPAPMSCSRPSRLESGFKRQAASRRERRGPCSTRPRDVVVPLTLPTTASTTTDRPAFAKARREP